MVGERVEKILETKTSSESVEDLTIDKKRESVDSVHNSAPGQSGSRAVSTSPESKEEPTHDGKPTWSRNLFDFVLQQWFLVALAILIAIASQFQVPKSQQETKRTVISYLCVSLIFFVTGCTLDTKILLQNYSRWKIHLFVQGQCFIITSAIVFGLVSATATSRFMDPGFLVGLIFLGCVATTISSNVIMTRQAHGNQALTVVQTTIGNFIGVFITPALVTMYTSVPTWYNAVLPPNPGHFAAIYGRVLKQLGLSIYLPLIVGQVIQYLFPKTSKRIFIDWKLAKLGSLCLLVLLWSSYDQAFASRAFDEVAASNKIFIVLISVALWLVFFAISFFTGMMWLPREDVVSVCYCVPAKAITMGVPLAATIWSNISLELESKILIPIVIYQGLQLAFGSILIPFFRKWVDAKEKDQEDKPSEAV